MYGIFEEDTEICTHNGFVYHTFPLHNRCLIQFQYLLAPTRKILSEHLILDKCSGQTVENHVIADKHEYEYLISLGKQLKQEKDVK